MTERAQYQRVHCWPCGGSGKLKGTRARAGSRDTVGRRKLKTCPDCFGYGYTEQRIKPRGAEQPMREQLRIWIGLALATTFVIGAFETWWR